MVNVFWGSSIGSQPGLVPISLFGVQSLYGKIRRLPKIERRAGTVTMASGKARVKRTPAVCERVDVGRLDLRRAVSAHVVGAQAVDDQQQDVQLTALGRGVVVRAAAHGGQDRGPGGTRRAGLQQSPATQARIHAARE